MSDTRPWITCHVLDTARGRPAPGIKVKLHHDSTAYPMTFDGQTNDDGRVESWTVSADQVASQQPRASLAEHLAHLKSIDHSTSQWVLTFETKSYNPDSFFDKVTINFTTHLSEKHYHVPLLLSPYGYTTYRGS